MMGGDSRIERLVRLLDGTADAPERAALEAELAADPGARRLLRDLAEQAVAAADLDRTGAALAHDGMPPVPFPGNPPRRHRWIPAAAAAAVAMLLGVGILWLRSGGREVARVTKVTGASGFFGTRGSAERAVPLGARLRAGDVVGTRSCDSWIELELRDGSRLTVAGESALRLVRPEAGTTRVSLERGNLWFSPSVDRPPARLTVRTPTAVLEASGAQFDLQATAGETIVRVNEGLARVGQVPDGAARAIPAGFQARVALSPARPPVIGPQPPPVTAWRCAAEDFPAVVLGHWRSPEDGLPARLRAVPLLWPVPNHPPVMLHVVGVSAFLTAGRPVELQPDSRVRFTGRTLREHTVRLGFSTQRMRGVFAGKFEVDVPASALGPAGETWTVELPVSAFRPLQPELSPSPAGLELNDIYALTVVEDAGLELHRVEITLP